MFRATIKSLAARKLRLLTTSVAVLLGVAFMAGTLVLTDTIGKTFDNFFANGNAGASAYVRGETAFTTEMGDSATHSTRRSYRTSAPATAWRTPKAASRPTPNSSTSTAR